MRYREVDSKKAVDALRPMVSLLLLTLAAVKTLSYGYSYESLSPSLTDIIIYLLSRIGIFIFFSLMIIETDGFFKKFIENKATFIFLWIAFILCGVTFMVNIWRVEGSEISALYRYYTISIWITMAVVSGLRALEIRKNRSTFWNS
ncbi:MAG: hypothetical protein ACLFVL_06020, partial [Candidatus Aenigmatarchaeota archaeon]